MKSNCKDMKIINYSMKVNTLNKYKYFSEIYNTLDKKKN